MAARADRCGTERGDHTKRQKLYVSVHGSRSDQSPSRELAENRTLWAERADNRAIPE